MTHIVWSDIYNIGINKLDKQHKHFLDILNNLQEGVSKDTEHTLLCGIFNELLENSKAHFDDEKKYMRQCGLPKDNDHANSHREFLRKIEDLKNRCKSDKVNLNVLMETQEFLREWLFSHIEQEYELYSPYLDKLNKKNR